MSETLFLKNIFQFFKTYKKKNKFDFSIVKTPPFFYHKTNLIFYKSKPFFFFSSLKTDLTLFQIKRLYFM